VTFPEIYQGKFSCVNDVSIMIDVFIATVYSGGVLTILCLFSVFFFSFLLFVCKKEIVLHFFMLVLINCFLEQIHIFFDVVIVYCMTAFSGFKMAAQNSK